MAFIWPNSEDFYVRVYKLPISTPLDKSTQTQGDFDFEVRLPERIQNVIGIKLVEWSFPRDLIPTFYPPTSKLTGKDRLDFRLFNPDISPVPADFTVALPVPRNFNYQDYQDPTRDFVEVLSRLMTMKVLTNPTWAGRVSVGLVPDSFQRTLILVSTSDQTLPPGSSTQLTLRFLSGPSGERNVYDVLGFDRVDVSSTTTYYQLPPGIQSILSPRSTDLRASDYIDVYVDESPQKPLQRVFFDDPAFTRNAISAQGTFRFEVDQDRPPRTIDKLHVRIRYENGIDPGTFLKELPIIVHHNMTFHFFTLQDSNTSKPDYIKQNLSY